MKDPDLCFEIHPDGKWQAYEYQNDYVGVYKNAYSNPEKPNIRLQGELNEFAQMWDKNIQEQGYVHAFREKLAVKEALSKQIAPLVPQSNSPHRGRSI